MGSTACEPSRLDGAGKNGYSIFCAAKAVRKHTKGGSAVGNTIKDDARDTGLRLLKKGRRGLLRAVFSRAGLILLMLLVQVALLVFLFDYLGDYLPHAVTVSSVFAVVMALAVLNGEHDASSKITWIIVITTLPVFGALLFLYTQSDLGHRILKRRFAQVTEDSRQMLRQDEAVSARLESEAPELLGLGNYVNRTGCFPVYAGSRVRYFPLGDELFPALLEELEQAERYIYLEFFVIAEGLMWGRVLEILARKAAQGVDVRLIYDGTNEFFTLPPSYPKRLEALGIRCKTFAPIRPFVSTLYNYRDHRKILVIDGKTAFNGGINLADEYINRQSRFGHWKDSGVIVHGPAAQSYALMFLQMWNIDEKEPDFAVMAEPPAPPEEAAGFLLPYGDCPLDDERVGEWVYMDLLNRARRYVHIMTPYLILDGEMETALKFAAERGVDVRLILPGVPDKKLPYALAKTHYASLLRSGVKICEYTPGFVHAKSFVVDDREAVVGTINLDYRSLYHHFECATYMSGVDCIKEIEADFRETQALCRQVSMETVKNESWTVKLAGILMKVIAPLL